MVCFGFPLGLGQRSMGAWKMTSQSNTGDGAGSAFSLFRRWVYFTFQSPLLFPTHFSFSRAKLWRKWSNTGNQKPAALRIFATGWTELRGETGRDSRTHTLSYTKTHRHMHEGGSRTFICSLLNVKGSYFWLNVHLSCAFASWSLPPVKSVF